MTSVSHHEWHHGTPLLVIKAAGEHVPEFRRTWLDHPPERAVLEARIEAEHAEEDAQRLNAAVNRVLTALRDHGYPAALDPAAFDIE